MFVPGAPAALLETEPWTNGPHADAVRATIAAHDPANKSAAASASRWLNTSAAHE